MKNVIEFNQEMIWFDWNSRLMMIEGLWKIDEIKFGRFSISALFNDWMDRNCNMFLLQSCSSYINGNREWNFMDDKNRREIEYLQQ